MVSAKKGKSQDLMKDQQGVPGAERRGISKAVTCEGSNTDPQEQWLKLHCFNPADRVQVWPSRAQGKPRHFKIFLQATLSFSGWQEREAALF